MSDIQIQNIDEAEIDTILEDDIEFTGDLGFDKSLLIKGKLKGNVKATGDLYVAESAVVDARVEAHVVSVKGRVNGNIYAYERVELFSCGRIDGDITAPDIIMESGCTFNGICTMRSPRDVLKSGKKDDPINEVQEIVINEE